MVSKFDTIWDEFSIPLRNFIKRRIHNDYDVEDVLQNVFMKIYISIDTLDKFSNIHAWIYTVTKNTIIDYYRMHKHDTYLDILSEDTAIFENTDEITTMNEISQCLEKMIQFLPEKYKQALTLTEFDNITQKQLADIEGLSISGAKSRVQRARLLLKEEFLSCCNLEKDSKGNIIDYQVKNQECTYCK